MKEIIMTNLDKIDALENEGMIDLMYHQYSRYTALRSLWQQWIEA